MSNLDNKRTSQYKKNATHENVLKSMNEALLPVEKQLVQNFSMPKHPIIFIVGAQRSGTTLLMQLIAQLFDVSYPTNFIARYWNAPYIGATLYKNLSSQLEHKELDLQSDLGYTKGLQGPHEFGYFWKRWFPWESWETPQYEKIDYSLLQKELSAWQSVNNTPLVFKNLIILNSNIEFLAKIFPNSFFINIERESVFNCQSTYQSRLKLFGNEKEWFGVKPPEYLEISKMPIFEQIVYQLFYIRNNIKNQLEKLEITRYETIKYENLIKNYNQILEDLFYKIFKQKRVFNNDIKLVNGNKVSVAQSIFDKFLSLCENIFGNEKDN